MYALLLSSSLLGALLPFLMMLSKLSANDFYYLRRYRNELPGLDPLLRALPFLDIERILPFLPQWSWHAPWDHRAWAGYGPVNTMVLVLVLCLRQRITRSLARCVEWLYAGDPLRPRAMVFGCACLLLLSYQTKSHLGFFLPGIGGWHYRDSGRQMQEQLPEPVTARDREVLAQSPFLDDAVLRQNARFLAGREGFLSGRALFLHFNNGAILPANNELADMVFPEYAFGRWEDLRRPAAYFEVIRAALQRRRSGLRFLLPIGIAYPNHIPFMFVDYTTYPPADLLTRITVWQLWVHIDREQQVRIVKATERLVIDAP